MNQYRYQEKDLLGGWQIEVWEGRAHIGNIRKNPSTGNYRYYKGTNNILTASFEESDIDDLKKRIESR